jgi:periplasmic divalent cation tolerance protein
MPEDRPPVRLVLTTAASAEEAAQLGRTLVEERLAACATLIPAVQSIYRWLGAVENATEALLLLKTSSERLPMLEARLRELHSYQTPEFLALDVAACAAPYLDWLLHALRPTE